MTRVQGSKPGFKAWQPVGAGLLLVFLTAANSETSDDTASQGHGAFSIGYQYIHVDGFESSIGKLPIGTTDTHVLNLEWEHQFSNGWGVEVGLPLITKRYKGSAPHDPSVLIPARDAEFLDDGSYHTHFQDWHLGISYLLKDDPLVVQPFVSLGVPSNDYPFFAHAAPGQNLWKVDIGSRFIYQPPFSDAWYRLDVSYVFVEETLGVSIDHWRVNAEIGYFLSPRWSVRGFALAKRGDGLVFPDAFPTPRVDEKWFQHDRLVKHNYVNAGVGLDWRVNDQYQLGLSALTMVYAEQVHVVDYAVTFNVAKFY